MEADLALSDDDYDIIRALRVFVEKPKIGNPMEDDKFPDCVRGIPMTPLQAARNQNIETAHLEHLEEERMVEEAATLRS